MDDNQTQENQSQEPQKNGHQVSAHTDSRRKRSPAFAITSLSLGLVSVPLAFLSIMLLRLPPGSESSALVLIGNPFAILGIIFGIFQLRKRRSARAQGRVGVVVFTSESKRRDYRAVDTRVALVESLSQSGRAR